MSDNNETLAPFTGEIRPVTAEDIRIATNAVGRAGAVLMLGDVDKRFLVRPDGKPGTLYMWSGGGHRVTFSAILGLVSRSKEVDPYYPGGFLRKHAEVPHG